MSNITNNYNTKLIAAQMTVEADFEDSTLPTNGLFYEAALRYAQYDPNPANLDKIRTFVQTFTKLEPEAAMKLEKAFIDESTSRYIVYGALGGKAVAAETTKIVLDGLNNQAVEAVRAAESGQKRGCFTSFIRALLRLFFGKQAPQAKDPDTAPSTRSVVLAKTDENLRKAAHDTSKQPILLALMKYKELKPILEQERTVLIVNTEFRDHLVLQTLNQVIDKSYLEMLLNSMETASDEDRQALARQLQEIFKGPIIASSGLESKFINLLQAFPAPQASARANPTSELNWLNG